MKKFSKSMLKNLNSMNKNVTNAENISNKRANIELKKFGVLVGDNDD